MAPSARKTSSHSRTAPESTTPSPPVFDPEGDAPTTYHLDAYLQNKKAMLNEYLRLVKVGGGQHGTVYLCHKINTKVPAGHPEARIEVAMKSVRRVNVREEKMKKLMQNHQRLPSSPHGVSVADKVNGAEAKVKKEIAIMKKLRHPHVVRLYEVIDDRMKEKIYMVMEYLGGGEVKWRDNNNNPVLTVGQTRRIIRDALLGLEYLHHQGIIHRDIKPANLLWTSDRAHIKIGDFGVSHFSYAQRLAAAGTDADAANQDPLDPLLLDDSSLTRRAGTPSFLAPEVIWEFRGVKGKSILSSGSESNSTSAGPSGPPSSSNSPTNGVGGGGSSPRSVHSLIQENAPGPSGANVDVTATPHRPPRQPFHSHSSPTMHHPERPPITKAIDVWALGVTLYCLLFGRTPFAADKIEFATEWVLYECIANDDWEVPKRMGFDGILTGGRHPSIDAGLGLNGVGAAHSHSKKSRKASLKSQERDDLDAFEGPSIVRLLERFLSKDPSTRITLEEVKHSSFLLHDLINADDWLRRTSPLPSARIDVSSNEASKAMSAVRFRAGWGTRIVRHVEHWFKRTPVPGPHIGGSANSSSAKGRANGVTSTIGIGSGRRTFGSATVNGATSTFMAGERGMQNDVSLAAPGPFVPPSLSRKDKGKAPTIHVETPTTPTNANANFSFDSKPRPSPKGSKRTLNVNGDQHPSPGQPSPVERTGGWWRRNVAGVRAWKPDKYDATEPDGHKHRSKEEKARKRRERKGKMKETPTATASTVEGVEYDDDDDDEDDGSEPYDPLASSRTFDDSPDMFSPPLSSKHGYNNKNFGQHEEYGEVAYPHGQLNPNSTSFGVLPPTTRRSEEALRMYRPVPNSSDSISQQNGLLTSARRASSWGQGDDVFEIQSVRSADVGTEMNERDMLVGAGGLHSGGVTVPDRACASAGGPASSPCPVQRREISRLNALVSSDPRGNRSSDEGVDNSNRTSDVESSRPSRDGTNEDGDDGDDLSSRSRSNHYAEDDDDDSSDDHAVTFSPRRRPIQKPEGDADVDANTHDLRL